jgi:hypothetical protein
MLDADDFRSDATPCTVGRNGLNLRLNQINEIQVVVTIKFAETPCRQLSLAGEQAGSGKTARRGMGWASPYKTVQV